MKSYCARVEVVVVGYSTDGTEVFKNVLYSVLPVDCYEIDGEIGSQDGEVARLKDALAAEEMAGVLRREASKKEREASMKLKEQIRVLKAQVDALTVLAGG